MADIFMDEIKVDKQSIELVDHEIIKLNYNQLLFHPLKYRPFLGNYSCIVISSTINTIECNIKPIPKGSILKDLIVSISIDGIKNDNKLLFSFDTPFISDILITQGIIKINGNCLGTNSSTQIYIDDVLQTNITINVNEKQTILLFQPSIQIKKSKLYLKNEIKSNEVILQSVVLILKTQLNIQLIHIHFKFQMGVVEKNFLFLLVTKVFVQSYIIEHQK
ncbi:hypothetical protein ACTFIZ_005381 [Dictyostelium cf. discoideum]